MRSRNHVVLFAMLLAACTGGQSGDPGQTAGGSGGHGGHGGGDAGPDSGPDTSGDDSACSGNRWDAPDAPQRSGQCEETAPGRFLCECEEKRADDDEAEDTVHDVATERCGDALREACAIDLRAPRSCTAAAIGSCFPTDDEAKWGCQCEGSDALIETDAASCTDALAAQCTEKCESAFGGCGQAFWDPTSYGCQCAGGEDGGANGQSPVVNGGVIPALGFESCAEALANTCGERCSSAAGECAIGEGDALDCTCSTGEEVSVPLEDVGGVGPEACWRSVAVACGEELTPALSECESSYDGHDARCEALPMIRREDEPVSNVWEHRCSCDGGDAETRLDITCYRALQASCPDAIPPSAVVAEAGELGALCESGSDCSGDACYVPGTQQDSICSALCEGDDDCPSDALCAAVGGSDGYCFARCDSDVECGLRNDAAQNPLYCARRSSIDAAGFGASDDTAGICVQRSEP